MFGRRGRNQAETPPTTQAGPKNPGRLLKISLIANIAILAVVLIALGGLETVHQSDTNPNFCGTCHVMQSHVQSYYTSSNLDHVHQQAGVQCKDCHQYSFVAEVKSGISYITGNYTATDDPNNPLPKRTFDDAMCTKCHISRQHVAQLTDFLSMNPHDAPQGMGGQSCKDCHVSHGTQIDLCSQCHDNGGQRMIGQPITPRGTIDGTASTSSEQEGTQPAATPSS